MPGLKAGTTVPSITLSFLLFTTSLVRTGCSFVLNLFSEPETVNGGKHTQINICQRNTEGATVMSKASWAKQAVWGYLLEVA